MPAGAPFGNKNAAKGFRWRAAIERALERRSRGDMIKALDELADKFLDAIEEAAAGNDKRAPSFQGFSELADRMDGKAVQPVQADVNVSGRLVIND